MTRTSGLDEDRLRTLLRAQRQVITCEQAYACGLTRKALDYRLRLDGPWQWLLPAVYVAETGTVTQDQRAVAALLGGRPRRPQQDRKDDRAWPDPAAVADQGAADRGLSARPEARHLSWRRSRRPRTRSAR